MGVVEGFCEKRHYLFVGLFLTLAKGEEFPSLEYSFSTNTQDQQSHFSSCPSECAAKLDEALKTISDLQTKVSDLEVILKSQTSSNLVIRVGSVETYLYENITTLVTKLASDLTTTSVSLHQEIVDTKAYIDSRLQSLPAAGSVDNYQILYTNITSRLDILEYSRLQGLVDEGSIWRKNFEMITKIFSKMRKSSYSNNVIITS